MDYIDAFTGHLDYICEAKSSQVTADEKMTFFRETRMAYGRTALVLSGGGALGSFHLVRPPPVCAIPVHHCCALHHLKPAHLVLVYRLENR